MLAAKMMERLPSTSAVILRIQRLSTTNFNLNSAPGTELPSNNCGNNIDSKPWNSQLRRPKIAIIGGGFSGICGAIQLQKRLGITSYTIFDENEDYGGTWWVNRYPGCACDTQSHLYSYSFELNPYWNKNYSSHSDIRRYLVNTAEKHGLRHRTKFLHRVSDLEWNDSECKWNLTVVDRKSSLKQEHIFDFVIIGVGCLRFPNVPQEFKQFTGSLIHSAEWDETKIDVTDKKVGVVGSDASAIQINQTIAPKVTALHCYQRRPAWVVPNVQFQFPKWINNLFATLPLSMRLFRWSVFLYNELYAGIFKDNSILNYAGGLLCKFHLWRQLRGHAALQTKLTPDYAVGCKRIMMSNDYFPIFKKSHVHLHREAIQKVQDNTIHLRDGSSQQLDILILATGFRVQDFFCPMKITGRKKVNVFQSWKMESPKTYNGILSSLMPNAFFLLGPNTATAYTSFVFPIECQVDFTLKLIEESLKRGVKSVRIRETAEDAWMRRMGVAMNKTVWGQQGGCQSWYSDDRGRATAVWPKNCIAYYNETKRVDFDQMEFCY